jgi:hypothetical protein
LGFHATQQINAKRADKNGTERSVEAYQRDAQGVLNAFNRYQVAEYNTAVSRTRTAKQWEEFTGDEHGNEIFPYLVWLPSRSVTKREEHIVFYNRYWRKDSPFWNQNQPGNLWNCKCDWQETDGSDGTPGEDTHKKVNHKGLEGNPAKTGEIFSENATYFKAVPDINKVEVEKQFHNFDRSILKQEAKNLMGKPLFNKDFSREIHLTGGGIKEFLNQPHQQYDLKNRLLPVIDSVIKNSVYKGVLIKRNEIDNFESHLFEISLSGKKSFVIVREYTDRCLVHSISDSDKVLNYLKTKTP